MSRTFRGNCRREIRHKVYIGTVPSEYARWRRRQYRRAAQRAVRQLARGEDVVLPRYVHDFGYEYW